MRTLLALVLGVLVASQAAAETPGGFVDGFNTARQERALPALIHEPRLALAAQWLAEDAARGRSLDVTRRNFCQRVETAGFPCVSVLQLVTRTPAPTDVAARSFFDDPRTAPAAATTQFRHFGVGEAPVPSTGYGPSRFWVVLIGDPPMPADPGWRESVLRQVNAFRARYGLRPLRLNPQLNRAAQTHADDMATRDFVAHVTPDGRGPGERAASAGYRWSVILENLAAGQPTPQEAVQGWIESDGHRRAMLDRRITEAGIGYRFLPDDKGRVRSFHYWALSMATPQ